LGRPHRLGNLCLGHVGVAAGLDQRGRDGELVLERVLQQDVF
jgi:hypothetical protein